MSRLTPTGLARFLPDEDDELEIRSSSGQTLRLRPQGRVRQDGGPLPEILGPDFEPLDEDRPFRDPFTGEEAPGGLSEQELIDSGAAVRDPLTGHLRVGDPIRGKLGYDVDTAQRASTRARSLEIQEQQIRQRQRQKMAQETLEREQERGLRVLRERGATPEEEAEFLFRLSQEYPEAVPSMPPSRVVADLIEDENPELKRSTVTELRKEYEATKDETLIPEISSRLSDLYGPDTARKWEDQEYQRINHRQERAQERFSRRAKEIKMGTTFSMSTVDKTEDRSWLPFYHGAGAETEHVFGVNDRNPFKAGTKEHQKFLSLQNEAKRQVNEATLAAMEEEFGPLGSAEHPESAEAARAEVDARDALEVPGQPARAVPYPTYAQEEASNAFRTGQLTFGGHFYDADGRLHRVNIDGTTKIISQ